MAIGSIIGVVLAALILSAGYAAFVSFTKKNKTGMVIAGIAALVLALCFVLIPTSFHTVDTGEVAVVKYLGEAKNVRTAGTHFDLWITNTYQYYDAKVQNVDIDTAAYSSDAQTMNVQMTLQYQIKSENVMDIAKQYGSLEILQSRIQSIAIEKTKAVLSSHKAMSIISDRAAMSPAVEKSIKDAIGDEYYVDVTAVVLTNIDFSSAFELAVEEKMIAEQQQLKAEYENQTKIAQAEADAQAKLVAAEADAKAQVLSAQAKAEANELLEKSLTDKILQEMYINKWNGELPGVVAGDSDLSFMLPSETAKAAE
ncbi:MAG: prohibitin family protein [Clostridia bacterium]|nr:prohibitin family protein [Clostridia bacterium]